MNPNPNSRYLTLTIFRNAGYETPCYEKVRVRKEAMFRFRTFRTLAFSYPGLSYPRSNPGPDLDPNPALT